MTAPNLPDFDKLKQSRERRRNFGWKPKAGPNKIRVFPPHSRYLSDWAAMTEICIRAKVHYFRIEGRPAEMSRCLEELKQRCPACEAWRVYRNSDDQGLKELARQIAPGEQFLFNIMDMNNLQAGIQPWAANYSCWDKILEMVANPSWNIQGFIMEPSNGLNFEITLTPGKETKTGFNSYSVLPDPLGRTNIMPVLEQMEAAGTNWKELLDKLEDNISEPKKPEEILTLLDEMGVPPIRGRQVGAPVSVGAPAAAQTAGPRPIGAVPVAAPAAGPTVVPAAVAAVPSVPSSPAPIGIPTVAAPAAPAALVPVAAAPAPAAVPAAGAPHYDPGPQYTEITPAAERPAGSPRCYGDFQPRVHRCKPCGFKAKCQAKALGIEEEE